MLINHEITYDTGLRALVSPLSPLQSTGRAVPLYCTPVPSSLVGHKHKTNTNVCVLKGMMAAGTEFMEGWGGHVQWWDSNFLSAGSITKVTFSSRFCYKNHIFQQIN